MKMCRVQFPVARWVLACAMTMCSLAVAAEAATPIELGKTQNFSERRAFIEKALSSSKRYSEISRADRKEVLEALARIDTALKQSPSLADLPAEKGAAVQRDQAFVNETLARAESDSALRCSTSMAIGSNIRSRNCETKAAKQRREAEEAKFGPPRLDVLR